MLESESRVMVLTYDSTKGEVNDENAYGQKTYKNIISDDYLFLDDDLKESLTNEDIEIVGLEFTTYPYQYKKIIGNYEWKWNSYDNNKTITSIIYGKRTNDGEWIKLAEMDSRGLDYAKFYNGAELTNKSSGYGLNMKMPMGLLGLKLKVRQIIMG